MIHGVGVIHSKVKVRHVQNMVAELDPDQVFVEGSRPSYMEKTFKTNYEEIKSEIENNLDFEINFEEDTRDMKIESGRESVYLKTETNIPDEEIKFLDEDLEKTKQIYLITRKYREDNKNTNYTPTGIDEEKLRKTLKNNNTTRKHILDYLEYLSNEKNQIRDTELVYTTMRNEKSFQTQIEKIGSNLNLPSQATQKLDSWMKDGLKIRTNYEDQFKQLVKEYNITQQDLQKLIGSEREHSQLTKTFQDKRDQNWTKQITEYLNKNPEDEIIILSGLDHLLDIPQRTTPLLKNNGFELKTHAIEDF